MFPVNTLNNTVKPFTFETLPREYQHVVNSVLTSSTSSTPWEVMSRKRRHRGPQPYPLHLSNPSKRRKTSIDDTIDDEDLMLLVGQLSNIVAFIDPVLGDIDDDQI